MSNINKLFGEQCSGLVINDTRKQGTNFVFAMPRSGSTLLMRLMYIACAMPVIGDRSLSFYQAWLQIKSSAFDGCMSGEFVDFEYSDVFMDTFASNIKSSGKAMLYYNLISVLFNGQGSNKFAKSTIIGFNNELMVPFCEAIRDVFGDRYGKHNIVFLTRNIDDVVRSMQTKDGPGKETAIMRPEIVVELLEEQEQQMKDSYELGDIWITYEELIKDPVSVMLKLGPRIQPIQKLVKEVMERKLR